MISDFIVWHPLMITFSLSESESTEDTAEEQSLLDKTNFKLAPSTATSIITLGKDSIFKIMLF